MIKKIIAAIILLPTLLLIYAAFQPEDYVISRELQIKAQAEQIFPHINHSQKADAWMPWAESDPQMKMSYSGPEEGVGSISKWTSTGDMGTGEAVVIESIPNQLVKTKLTYTQPMEMLQIAELKLTPNAEGTLVRWSVSGKNNLISRVFSIVMNIDKMVGSEFEKGLLKLKQTVENK